MDVGTVAANVADAAVDWGFEAEGEADASSITEQPGRAEFTLTVGDQRFRVVITELTG